MIKSVLPGVRARAHDAIEFTSERWAGWVWSSKRILVSSVTDNVDPPLYQP